MFGWVFIVTDLEFLLFAFYKGVVSCYHKESWTLFYLAFILGIILECE